MYVNRRVIDSNNKVSRVKPAMYIAHETAVRRKISSRCFAGGREILTHPEWTKSEAFSVFTKI
jgi:hypothetical protein